jgi:hypothetical protein
LRLTQRLAEPGRQFAVVFDDQQPHGGKYIASAGYCERFGLSEVYFALAGGRPEPALGRWVRGWILEGRGRRRRLDISQNDGEPSD